MALVRFCLHCVLFCALWRLLDFVTGGWRHRPIRIKKPDWLKKQIDLNIYTSMLEKFVSGEMPVAEFERAYLRLFKDEKGAMTEDLFLILDWMFSNVDMYTDLPLEEFEKS